MTAEPAAGSRRRAAAIAGFRGDLAEAVSALHDGDPGVRSTALGALERMGRLELAQLRAALADDDPVVRTRAARIAAGVPDVDLSPLLADDDDTVVEEAAWACGERGVGSAHLVPVLAALAEAHRDPLVREAAVAALGAIGDPAGVSAILAATADKPAIRRRAVIALAPFEGSDVDAALERARHDRDWQVRQVAEDLLDG